VEWLFYRLIESSAAQDLQDAYSAPVNSAPAAIARLKSACRRYLEMGSRGMPGRCRSKNCEGNLLARFGFAYPFRFGDFRTSAAGQGKVLLMRNSHDSYSPFFL
jgi:hypothetical protein